MTTKKLVVVVKSHDFRGNTIEQLFVTAAWQIGSADRTAKQNVSHQDNFVRVVDIDNMPGSVARAVSDFELMLSNGQNFALFQPTIGRNNGDTGETTGGETTGTFYFLR